MGIDDISTTTLTCRNQSGSVNRSSCRWQNCYVCLETLERCPKSHQVIHCKLQVFMELQFLPACTWTQRLQVNIIHSPKFILGCFRYFLAVHLPAATTSASLHSMVNHPCHTDKPMQQVRALTSLLSLRGIVWLMTRVSHGNWCSKEGTKKSVWRHRASTGYPQGNKKQQFDVWWTILLWKFLGDDTGAAKLSNLLYERVSERGSIF